MLEKIGPMTFGGRKAALVFAEIGINHNGDMSIARKLIDVAADCGCDAVKFQKRTVDIVYSPQELAAPREVNQHIIDMALQRGVLSEEAVARLKQDRTNTTNGDLKYALEFTEEEYAEIDEYCRQKGIVWFASPWDVPSLEFLEQFEVPCHKIASASLTDDELLAAAKGTGKPVILSTGMSDLPMVRHAVEQLDRDNLMLLHCTSVYAPAFESDPDDAAVGLVNLRGIETLKKEFPDVPVGYSSHDLGILPSYAAAVMGACAVEKHITLNRGMAGSDQPTSIEPDDLRRLCRALRELPIALGDGEIKFFAEEIPAAKKLRRNWGVWDRPQ